MMHSVCMMRLTHTYVSMMHSVPIRMKHMFMMHACVIHVKNGDERTDGKLNSRSRIIFMAAYWFERFSNIELELLVMFSKRLFVIFQPSRQMPSIQLFIRVGTAGVSRRSEALWREALLASRQASLTKFFLQRK